MAHLILPKAWQKIAPQADEEQHYMGRRQALRQLGILTGASLLAPVWLTACRQTEQKAKGKPAALTWQQPDPREFDFKGMQNLYPAERNMSYPLDRPMTNAHAATHHNNFYEFIDPKGESIYDVYKHVDSWDTSDWHFKVSGLVEKPGIYYLEDVMKQLPLEERTYRFRCVERWSMAVPWSGFSLAQLIQLFEPKSKARYLKMTSASNPAQMIGVRYQDWYPWPYHEALCMDEAMHELSFIATGIYGKPLPRQNGAPMRLVVPWKYGYKSIKSIVHFELSDTQPSTFWNQISPEEYPFESNVDPEVPHPRWSQKVERMIPDGTPRATLPYNGYGELVARLYT